MLSASPGVRPGPNVLIARMSERADLSQESKLPRGPERRAAVFADLTATATRTQAPVLPTLERLKAEGAITDFESMALPNAILLDVAEGKGQVVRDALTGVAQIEAVTQNEAFAKAPFRAPAATAQPEMSWALTKIGADKAQAAGWDGRGITVGITDSGLDLASPAVTHAYGGRKADGTYDHDYSWYDPFEEVTAPIDRQGHGTSVSAFVAGLDGEQATGVAPKARLIASTVLRPDGYNVTSAALQGLQFMLAPTKVDGTAPDPRKGADVVNMSWGNPDLGDSSMRESIDGLRAAGIVLVAGAGNSGPTPNSMLVPAAYPGVISVGGTDRNDDIYDNSSPGDPKDASKPRPVLAAPGEGVLAVRPGNEYQLGDGTSYASPHVTGAVASMLQAVPNASDEQILHALTSTATDVAEPGNDATTGAGRINVDKAIEALIAAAGPQQ